MQPNHPLFQTFPNEFEFVWPYDGAKTTIEWIEREKDLFWREKNTDLRRVWHCFQYLKAPGKTKARHNSLGFESRFEKSSPQFHFAYAFNAGFLRRFYIASEDELFINQRTAILHRPGATVDLSCELPRDLFIDFFKPHQFLFAEPLVVQSQIAQWKSRPGSRLLHARGVIDQFENPWSYLDFVKGTRVELEPLLWSLPILFGPRCHWRKYFSFFHHGRGNYLRLSAQGSGFSIPHPIFYHLNANFRLRVESSIRIRDDRYNNWRKPGIHFGSLTSPAAPPTPAEKHQALVHWRNFLAGKIADLEIRELLPSA